MADQLWLRHVALVTDRFHDVVADVRAVLGLEVCFTHEDMVTEWGPELVEEFGIASATFPLGDTFLEVIAPMRPDTRAGRYLEARGGETGYMVIVQTDDLERRRARAVELAIREVWHGGVDGIRTSHLHPRDTGGSLLSVDQPEVPAEWPWVGSAWRRAVRTDVTTDLLAATVEVADPPAVAQRWAALLERDVDIADDALVIQLDRGVVRFVHALPEAGEGVIGITLTVVDPNEVRRRARARALQVSSGGRILLGGLWVCLEPG